MLPLITPADRKAISHLPRSIEEHVDIADLTWSDRERVLRLLFSKINNSEPMQHMPPHLLDLQDDGGAPAMPADYFDIGPSAQEGDATFLTTDGPPPGSGHGASFRGAGARATAAPLS
jgi:hypothetical protein